MPSMYILECADTSFYVGSAQNLAIRFIQHLEGEECEYTKLRLPVKLVYCEYYGRIDYAFNREHQVKGWSRKKKIALIEGRLSDLRLLSRCKQRPFQDRKKS